MKKSQLPVSQRFYNDISTRVNSALSAVSGSAAETMRIVDCYMAGKEPESDDPMAMLAFNMVKAEIDRAMTRSQRARERAKSRKSATTERPHHSSGKISAEVPADDPAPAPVRPKSRRERRAALNLMRRLKKPRWGAIA